MFKLIATFIAVYEHNSFTKAAEQLFLTQPTVSGHIKKLEDELDCQLFIRTSNQAITACQSAHQFYPQAVSLISKWELNKQGLHDEQQLQQPIHFAASLTIGTELMPPLITYLSDIYPKSEIRLTICNSTDVITMMETARCDLGFIESDVISSQLSILPLCDDRLIKVSAPNNHWLIREHGSGLYHFTNRYLATQNISPSGTTVVNSNEVLVKLANDQLGNTLLSERYLPRLTVPTTFLTDEMTRQFSIVHQEQQLEDVFFDKLIQRIITFTATL